LKVELADLRFDNSVKIWHVSNSLENYFTLWKDCSILMWSFDEFPLG